nr:RNA-directed DNA polymerase, eukaryota [Tanacetum cinerariifolium]
GNVNQVEESDVEEVSDTIFEVSPQAPRVDVYEVNEKDNSHHSDDPFGLYDLLRKSTNLSASKEDPSLSHPPGFTPASHGNDSLADSSTHVSSHFTPKGGSVLEVLDGMIKVGRSIGYDIEGCSKDIEQIIKLQGEANALQETKMESISHVDVKFETIFKKVNVSISDNFFALYGIWLPTNSKILIVVIYAPQSFGLKHILWDYISGLITHWNEETIVLGDFNEMRSEDERFGSIFHQSYAREFNYFISSSGLLEVKMEGYSFTWSHSSASKMSKLDRFLVFEGIFMTFPTISAICLDRHLSDHCPILLNEIHTDYGPTPFWVYHSWFKRDGFDALVENAWNSFTHNDSNWMIRFKKKLQDLKKNIRVWIRESNASQVGAKKAILDDLVIIDKNLDKGMVSNELLAKRMDLSRKLHDLKQMELKDATQKAKVNWAIEGDENSKFFMESLIRDPSCGRLKLNMSFPNRLSSDQVGDLDKDILIDEIHKAVWDCAVNCFFDKGRFPRGSNSSFIALIPKVMDAKFITDSRPISLIGSVYKVVTKILANHLTTVISSLISNTQSAFVANRHILDGPFILNEVLAWCKRKRKQALVFKVDFAKAYDLVWWDFLLDILLAFGFGLKWCQWIRGIFSSNMASILINESPSSEFSIFSGLKQGDPFAPFLFILVMESFHLSITRAVNDGIFKGLRITGSSSLSHLLYADDVVFIGEWSIENLDNLLKILNCFHLASVLCINVNKSHVLGVGVPLDIVRQGALRIGCEVMQTPFKYLGVMVGDHMSRYSAWSNTIQKVRGRLTRWKVKTLSIGGRLTLLKSVLGAGGDSQDSKITWVAWAKVLSSKKNRGLGVSSFFALNRALLLKWVWRYLVPNGSLWYHIINAIYGSRLECHSRNTLSPWGVILQEVHQYFCDLNGDGAYRVEDIRSKLDDLFLPSSAVATRWVNLVPIKVNIFTWHVSLDRLPTRAAEESFAALEICCRRRKCRCGAKKAVATTAEHLVLLESKL